MKRSLISLGLMALILSFGCKSKDDTAPDPLATRIGFCQAWADAACTDKVLDYCNVPKVEDCQSTQSDFCLGLIPENYSSAHAEECLKAVGDAYADGDLKADELATVLKLEAPCDRLSSGTSSDGQSCEKNDDCDTSAGLKCIIKLGSGEGRCGEPEEIQAGDACDGPNQVCTEGYFCNGENCVAYKKTAASCEGDYMCKPVDHCAIAKDETTGTCEQRADLSDDCTSDQDCQSHYCAIATGASEGKCASQLRLALNEPLCDQLR